jgi:hypothetical protein
MFYVIVLVSSDTLNGIASCCTVQLSHCDIITFGLGSSLLGSTFVFTRHFGTKTISSRSHFEDDSSPHISGSGSSIRIDLTFVLFKHVILRWINYLETWLRSDNTSCYYIMHHIVIIIIIASSHLSSLHSAKEQCLFLSFVYFLVSWHSSAVSLPPGGVIFAQLVCPLNDVIFCLHHE